MHNAVEQAKTVAYMINGEQKPYNQVPWFWSDQYDIKLQIAGLIDDNNEKIIRGSLKEDKFSVFLLKNGRLLAVESVNSPKDFIIGRKLIGSQCIITREQIEDVNFDLKDLINK